MGTRERLRAGNEKRQQQGKRVAFIWGCMCCVYLWGSRGFGLQMMGNLGGHWKKKNTRTPNPFRGKHLSMGSWQKERRMEEGGPAELKPKEALKRNVLHFPLGLWEMVCSTKAEESTFYGKDLRNHNKDEDSFQNSAQHRPPQHLV